MTLGSGVGIGSGARTGSGAACWVFKSHTSASTEVGAVFCQLIPAHKNNTSPACINPAISSDGRRLGSGGMR
ncbi:MAG: hypothetical protein V4484_00485 [Pseudomonadota bacterium]